MKSWTRRATTRIKQSVQSIRAAGNMLHRWKNAYKTHVQWHWQLVTLQRFWIRFPVLHQKISPALDPYIVTQISDNIIKKFISVNLQKLRVVLYRFFPNIHYVFGLDLNIKFKVAIRNTKMKRDKILKANSSGQERPLAALMTGRWQANFPKMLSKFYSKTRRPHRVILKLN